jgi:predicted membrane protein
MEETKNTIDKRIIVGMILILLGGLFLLNSFNIIDFYLPRIIFSFPFMLFMAGIIILINSSKKIFGGTLASIGFIFLLPRIFPSVHIEGHVVVPIILISIGIYIILKQRERAAKTFNPLDPAASTKRDVIDDVAIFGGGNKYISSENFKGGSITAIFGGSEINLISCKLAEGIQVIDVLAIFGGTTLIVPRDWNVQLNITPIFGGFSNKIFRDPTVPVDNSRTLIVKGLAMFGGGEIKSTF